MRNHITGLQSVLIIVMTVCNCSYSQDMTIQQTVSYINDKLSKNNIEAYDDLSSSISIKYRYTLTTEVDGRINLIKTVEYSSENYGVFGKIIVEHSFLPDDVKSIQNTYIQIERKYYSGFDVFCTNYNNCMVNKARKTVLVNDWDGWMGLQLKWIDEKLTQSRFSVAISNGSDAESLINAFQYLCDKMIKENEKLPKAFDPFAKKPVSFSDETTSKNYSENEGTTNNYSNIVAMVKMEGGTYEVPVVLNDVLRISFIFDSGASDISIAPDVALTLIRTGTIKESDFIGTQKYRFADGSTATSKVFSLRSIKIGNKEVKDVKASISSAISAPMLLGQSVLQRFGKFAIDNKNHTLTIN